MPDGLFREPFNASYWLAGKIAVCSSSAGCGGTTVPVVVWIATRGVEIMSFYPRYGQRLRDLCLQQPKLVKLSYSSTCNKMPEDGTFGFFCRAVSTAPLRLLARRGNRGRHFVDRDRGTTHTAKTNGNVGRSPSTGNMYERPKYM